AAVPGERVADDLLTAATRVDVRGVDHRDPAAGPGVGDPPRFRRVGRTPEVHRPETQRTHPQPGGSERTGVHYSAAGVDAAVGCTAAVSHRGGVPRRWGKPTSTGPTRRLAWSCHSGWGGARHRCDQPSDLAAWVPRRPRIVVVPHLNVTEPANFPVEAPEPEKSCPPHRLEGYGRAQSGCRRGGGPGEPSLGGCADGPPRPARHAYLGHGPRRGARAHRHRLAPPRRRGARLLV